MGLFRNDRRDLEEALESLLLNVGANYRSYAGVEEAVKDRIAEVNAAAERMKRRGKAEEVRSIAEAWYEKQPPTTAFFRGDSSGVGDELDRQESLWADVDRDLPPIAGSGPKAQAEEERRDEIAKMRAARECWRTVLAGLTE